MQLTARQATLLHGWMNARPFLTWADVRAKGLLLPRLAELGLRARDLAAMQPDPKEWAAHAGAEPCHARFMLAWPANPLADLGADLADVIALKPSAVELRGMGVTHAQLVAAGMVEERFERMFRFSDDEWGMLGKKPPLLQKQ